MVVAVLVQEDVKLNCATIFDPYFHLRPILKDTNESLNWVNNSEVQVLSFPL